MAHSQQIDFCRSMKSLYPDLFQWRTVLDLGSLDINGNNRYLFEDCSYCGVDLGKGSNVDVVSVAHELKFQNESFDFIISTEMLEHDMHWKLTLKKVTNLLKPRGLFLMTCAGAARHEHGTLRASPNDSPFQNSKGVEWATYYQNLKQEDFEDQIDFMKVMSPLNSQTMTPTFSTNPQQTDLYFFGQKNLLGETR